MKFDPSKLLPETISLILSALIYDEKNFISRCRDLFGFASYCFTDKTGRYFYAVVIDEQQNNRCWVVFRGTDGDNWFGRVLSWVTINLRIAQTKDGFHKGFWKIATMAMNSIIKVLMYGFTTIYVCGHSQGAGVTVAFFTMLCRLINKNKIKINYLQGDQFAAPPAVNEKGMKEVEGHLCKSIKLFDWQQPGDPILTDKLRKKRGPLSGRNVGEKIDLPNLIPNGTMQDLASHSPSIYLWAYREMVPHEYDKEAVTYALENGMIVN